MFFMGGFDVQTILTVYSSVGVSYLIYVLLRKGIIGESEMKELLAITLAIIKALNESGFIEKQDLWRITESIYEQVMFGRKPSAVNLVKKLYEEISSMVVRNAEKVKESLAKDEGAIKGGTEPTQV